MYILWSVLVTAAVAHKVVDSTEDIGPEAFTNVTTLFPITNKTNANNQTIPDQESKEDSSNSKSGATVWKIDAKFAQPDLDADKENLTKAENNMTKEFRPSQHLGSYIEAGPTGSTSTSFTPIKKPASGFISYTEDHRLPSKTPKEIYQTHKQFPYKFDSTIYTRAKHPWGERPNDPDAKPWKAGFDSSEAWPRTPGPDFLEARFPKPTPDSFEPRPWKPGVDSLESRPTVESPVKLPAGGLYKYQDPFREKPGKDHDDDFGLEFNEGGKENPMKKRGSPFEDLLRIVTALLPVGLIISALTPSLITIENTGPGYPYSQNLPYRRRSDPGAVTGGGGGGDLSSLPVISERCRRRLLCELHSNTNYLQTSPHRDRTGIGKQCYRIRCEERAARGARRHSPTLADTRRHSPTLADTLRWLLDHRRAHNLH